MKEENERKYSPSIIHFQTAGHFFITEELKNKQVAGGEIPTHEFRVFIRILGSQDRCYLIQSEADGPSEIWEGICTPTLWRKEGSTVLLMNKDKLGAVIVQKNFKTLKEYISYEEFWADICVD